MSLAFAPTPNRVAAAPAPAAIARNVLLAIGGGVASYSLVALALMAALSWPHKDSLAERDARAHQTVARIEAANR